LDGELRRVYENTIKEVETVLKNIISKKFPMDEQELKDELYNARKNSL
jgi:hypothetical protein